MKNQGVYINTQPKIGRRKGSMKMGRKHSNSEAKILKQYAVLFLRRNLDSLFLNAVALFCH